MQKINGYYTSRHTVWNIMHQYILSIMKQLAMNKLNLEISQCVMMLNWSRHFTDSLQQYKLPSCTRLQVHWTSFHCFHMIRVLYINGEYCIPAFLAAGTALKSRVSEKLTFAWLSQFLCSYYINKDEFHSCLIAYITFSSCWRSLGKDFLPYLAARKLKTSSRVLVAILCYDHSHFQWKYWKLNLYCIANA